MFFRNTEANVFGKIYLKSGKVLPLILGFIHPAKVELLQEVRSHLENGDQFVLPKGIKGRAMTAFTLAHFPYVLKLHADTSDKVGATQDVVTEKYELVRLRDRAGRLPGPFRYRNLEFGKSNFSQEVLDELIERNPNTVRMDGDHVLFENIYLQYKAELVTEYLKHTSPEESLALSLDFGDFLKDLSAVGLFPGAIKGANAGVIDERFVYFDFDEVDFLIDPLTGQPNFQFSLSPAPRSFEEMTRPNFIWVSVVNEVFTDEFLSLVPSRHQRIFKEIHGDVLSPTFWEDRIERLKKREIFEVFPYPWARRRSMVDPSFQRAFSLIEKPEMPELTRGIEQWITSRFQDNLVLIRYIFNEDMSDSSLWTLSEILLSFFQKLGLDETQKEQAISRLAELISSEKGKDFKEVELDIQIIMELIPLGIKEDVVWGAASMSYFTPESFSIDFRSGKVIQKPYCRSENFELIGDGIKVKLSPEMTGVKCLEVHHISQWLRALGYLAFLREIRELEFKLEDSTQGYLARTALESRRKLLMEKAQLLRKKIIISEERYETSTFIDGHIAQGYTPEELTALKTKIKAGLPDVPSEEVGLLDAEMRYRLGDDAYEKSLIDDQGRSYRIVLFDGVVEGSEKFLLDWREGPTPKEERGMIYVAREIVSACIRAGPNVLRDYLYHGVHCDESSWEHYRTIIDQQHRDLTIYGGGTWKTPSGEGWVLVFPSALGKSYRPMADPQNPQQPLLDSMTNFPRPYKGTLGKVIHDVIESKLNLNRQSTDFSREILAQVAERKEPLVIPIDVRWLEEKNEAGLRLVEFLRSLPKGKIDLFFFDFKKSKYQLERLRKKLSLQENEVVSLNIKIKPNGHVPPIAEKVVEVVQERYQQKYGRSCNLEREVRVIGHAEYRALYEEGFKKMKIFGIYGLSGTMFSQLLLVAIYGDSEELRAVMKRLGMDLDEIKTTKGALKSPQHVRSSLKEIDRIRSQAQMKVKEM
ncbi:MAG: bifunctional isocitrate dehydrogenase kinase/phosphatase [Chlamydiae bacterium]|nr:bifunctional isocitrate dehydrogenase kinase/phosphatase [Chlamydiota bacterium]